VSERIEEDVDERGWRKPILVDDWGVCAYFLRVVNSSAGTRGIYEQDQTQRLTPGSTWRVLWPDGAETIETLQSQTVRSTVQDMGHEYPVQYEEVFVRMSAHGICYQCRVTELRFKTTP